MGLKEEADSAYMISSGKVSAFAHGPPGAEDRDIAWSKAMKGPKSHP